MLFSPNPNSVVQSWVVAFISVTRMIYDKEFQNGCQENGKNHRHQR